MAILSSKYRKYGGSKITLEDVERIKVIYKDNGWDTPKYLQFIQWALMRKYRVILYEAQTTVSKYVTVRKGNKSFKVRFSNHKPSKFREERKDCDFFVGVTNFHITNTENAMDATIEFLEERKLSYKS